MSKISEIIAILTNNNQARVEWGYGNGVDVDVDTFIEENPNGNVAELYLKYADKLGINPARISTYKANNKIVSANTVVKKGTIYNVLIEDSGKGLN